MVVMNRAGFALMALAAAAHAQQSRGLSLQGRIDLPGVEGRIDHLAPDVPGRRLFVAALGNHSIEVLDTRERKRIGSIPNLAEPQGVYFHSAAGRLFAACAGDGAVKVFDAKSLRLLASAGFSSDADNLRYDARRNRIVVGYGEGALGFLDLDGKKTGEIALGAHPESFRIEQKGTLAYVNLPDKREIAVVDLDRNALKARWPVASAQANFPMALDEAGRQLLVGCRSPARLLIFDTTTGKQNAAADIVGDTDDLFYDPAKNRVYVVGGGGFVDVLERTDSGNYIRAGRYPTAPGARTGLFVPEWGELFVAVPHRGEQKAAILVFKTE